MYSPKRLKRFEYSKSCRFVGIDCSDFEKFDDDLENYFVAAVKCSLVIPVINSDFDRINSIVKGVPTSSRTILVVQEEHNSLGLIDTVLIHESNEEALMLVDSYVEGEL